MDASPTSHEPDLPSGVNAVTEDNGRVRVAKKSDVAARPRGPTVLRTKTEDLRTVVLRPAVIKVAINGERLMLASDTQHG